MIAEFKGNQRPNYTAILGSKAEVQKALKRLQVDSPLARVLLDKWMSRANICQMVPNAYSQPLILLGEEHGTYLSNRVGPQQKECLWPIVLAFVDQNHWVAVVLQEVDGVIPFPP